MPTLSALQSEPSWQKRRELVRQTTDVGVLLAWLPHEKEGWVRAAVATELGKLGGAEALSALRTLAKKDPSPVVQLAAQGALSPPVASPQREKLFDPEIQVRAHAARQFGKQGGPEARAALLHALTVEPNLTLGLGLVRALWSWPQRDVLSAIHAFLSRSGEYGINVEVTRILEQRLASLPVNELEQGFLTEPNLALRERYFKHLCQRGPVALDVLTVAYEREENVYLRYKVVEILRAQTGETHWVYPEIPIEEGLVWE